MRYTNLLLLIAVVSVLGANAQTEPTIPTLISLPGAEQPKGGYEPGGAVRIRVKVNESGEVTSATFLSGPGPVCSAIARPDIMLARETALKVARRAKFTPAKSNGVPVASTANISVELPRPKLAVPKDDDIVPLSVLPSEPSTLRENESWGLNRKAISLPRPKYPSEARAKRASGAVQVATVIDEDGNVFSARAAGGNPLFQPAAITAACNAKFSPTFLNGQPVKVSALSPTTSCLKQIAAGWMPA
jgi:TonB family protein